MSETGLAQIDAKEYYKVFFESNPLPMWIYDLESLAFIDVNNAAIDHYGYTREEFLAMTIKDIRPPEDVERLLSNIRTLENSLDKPGLWRHVQKGGKIITVEITSHMVNYNGRKAEVVLASDVSARINAEETLLKAKQKAEESDRLKSAFLANMSHEIRTPINAILGFSQLLTDEEVTPESRDQFVKVICSNAHQLLHIIEDIIDISKIEVNQLKVDITQEVPVNSLLFDLFLMFKSAAQASGVNLYLSQGLSDVKATVFTDGMRLRQILNNLIGNSLKFTQKGFVKAGYRLKDNLLEFFVEDSGIGISDKQKDIIFEPFRQAENTFSKKRFSGTGLGLTISKALSELLGGSIWLESTEGKGSKFMFTIPYKPVHPEPEISGDTPSGKEQKQILVAEDEVANFLYLEMLLVKDGYRTLHATNGLEAVDMVSKNPDIAMVLMDIRMPVMDGYEATRRIKEMRPQIPVIAQTAYAFAEEREKILACGCDEILTKPILKGQVLDVLTRYLK
jgi:PAS domain S-box-containing protein